MWEDVGGSNCRCVSASVWRVKEGSMAGVRKQIYTRCIDVERQVCKLCKFCEGGRFSAGLGRQMYDRCGENGKWQVWEGKAGVWEGRCRV